MHWGLEMERPMEKEKVRR
jgi:hypothetical protein